MPIQSMLKILAIFTLGSSMHAVVGQSSSTGAITGVADPGAQIVVTQIDGGKVIGAMVKCDGSYRVEPLEPGRYQIVEGGPHHEHR